MGFTLHLPVMILGDWLEKAHRERERKWKECLIKKADTPEQYCRLLSLHNVFEPQAKQGGDDQFRKIVSVLQNLIETEKRQFDSLKILDEVLELKLFSEEHENFSGSLFCVLVGLPCY